MELRGRSTLQTKCGKEANTKAGAVDKIEEEVGKKKKKHGECLPLEGIKRKRYK